MTNLSRSIVYEMIVVTVENPNAPLPYDYNTGQIPEKQVKMLGETEDMQPNAEKTITLDLKPGAYLLICNVPGHYVDAPDGDAIALTRRRRTYVAAPRSLPQLVVNRQSKSEPIYKIGVGKLRPERFDTANLP